MLDGARPDDPDVVRLWIISQIAEAYHVLPRQAAEDLDSDPEQLSLKCLPLIRYAEAKHAEEHQQDESEMKAWRGSQMMKLVLENKFQLHRESVARREAEEREAAEKL